MNREQSKRRLKEYEELMGHREREDQLKHHGVKGMKWGVRRYQPYTDSNKRKGGKGGVFKGIKERRATKKKAKRQKVLDGRASSSYVMSEAESKKMQEVEAKHTDKNGNLDFEAFKKDWNTNHHGKYKPEKYTVPDAKKIYENAPRKEKKALREKAYRELMDTTAEVDLKASKATSKGKDREEKAKIANEYISKNKDKLPEGVEVKYEPTHTTSDGTPLPIATYRGKKMRTGDRKSEAILEYIGWNLEDLEHSALVDELVNDQFLKHGIDLGEFYDREA